MKLNTNAQIIAFLKHNWLIALLILLLLFLLPKLVNAYALVLQNLSGLLGRLETAPGNFLRNTAKGLREGIDNLLGVNTETTSLVATVGLAIVTPPPIRWFLIAWRITDFFKGDEQITVRRDAATNSQPDTDGGPVIVPETELGGF